MDAPRTFTPHASAQGGETNSSALTRVYERALAEAAEKARKAGAL